MAITTTVPFRRLVGKLIRGVADGSSGAPRGIPLAEAQVTFDALIDSAVKGELVIFDTIQAVTDANAVLRNPETNEPGVWLVPTNDPTVGATGWTWHVTVSTPSGGILHEFDMIVPSGSGDLDLKDVMPVPGNIGQAVLDWEQAVLTTAQNAADALSYRNTALSYRDQTNTHRANAVTARTGAETARTGAEAAATAAALTASMIQDAVMRAPSMIFNGGYELGTGTAATGWALTAAEVDRSASTSYRGTASLLLPQSSNLSEALSDAAPTEEGRWVRMSTMYRTASTHASLGGPRIQWSADGNTWTQLGASPSFTHSSAWAYYEFRRQMPAGAKFVRARFGAGANTPTIRLDETRLDDITELVAAETAAAAAQTAFNNSIASVAISGNKLMVTRNNGTTYDGGTVTVPGAQGPAGKLTGNGDNMVLDPNIVGALEDNWVVITGGANVARATVTGAPGNAIRVFGPSVRLRNLNQVPVSNIGEFWQMSAYVQNTATAGKLLLRITERASNGGYIRARTVEIPAQGWGPAGGVVQISGTATGAVPSGTPVWIEFEIESDAGFAGQAWLTSLEMRSLNRPTEFTANTLERLDKRSGRDAVFVGSSNVLAGGWATLLSDAMGWTPRHYAVGGTGFTQGDAGNDNNFLQQLTKAATNSAIVNTEVANVLIADTGNDIRSANTSPNIGIAANNAVIYAKAQFPNARITIVPVLWGPHAWNDDPAQWRKLTDVVEQLRNVAMTQGIGFAEDSWLWHHNDSSSMISGEVHYNAVGHGIIRDRMLQYFRNGECKPIREWNQVGAANANITIAPDGAGDYRGLSVKREGALVSIQGRAVTSVAANNAVWAVVPNGFRPTFAQEIHCRIGTLSTVGVVGRNGNITVWANAAAGATLTFGATYRVD